ncbi:MULTISPECIES: barstar family protein [unclassified Mycolicibacterium]|nr:MULTISPECIES: barstar family protein [unclassified Mycolicibacterium]
MNVNDFVEQAGGNGPCIAFLTPPATPVVPPDGVELRTVDGARIPTLKALFDVFAAAWHFPAWFGRNPAAFDDFMCDLDNMIDVALGKPPARGYLTEVTNAHLLFVDQPDVLPWFSRHVVIYRDYYRDQASPTAAFGLLLTAPDANLDEVRAQWAAAGAVAVTDIV